MGIIAVLLDTADCIVMINYYIILAVFNFFRQFISPKKKDISNDIALITGGGSGIGRALCLKIAPHVKAMVITDISQNGLEETKALAKQNLQVDIHIYVCDCGNEEDIQKLSEKIINDVGDVTLLINNAGVVSGKTLKDMPTEEFLQTFRINTFAHFYTIKSFLPGMQRQNRGHIVGIASSAGFIGVPRMAEYCSSKAATIILLESFMMELKYLKLDDTIKVSIVCPYLTKTNLFSGFRSKYQWIMPDLDVDYLVDKIFEGILSNKYLICVSRHVFLLSLTKGLLPTDAHTKFIEFSGGFNCMENFRGNKSD